ncbi:hypothetical protein [Bacillus alkalicellulosilyticus]|uniref:hypothetical protein n=1 Tax=Alkalihalobacterium alkalicellulosilyticum TaxID=1912214 RepID=UPI000998BDEF|nr:hypothetical protein [Bacillus alkalicellulosilyticus]
MTIEQTNIFSLFGIEDEYEVKKKKEEEERMKKIAEMKKKAEENKSSSSATKPADTFEINENTTVYFYTEVIAVTDYFTVEELVNGLPTKKKDSDEIEYKKITEAEVKKRLKKDYPVLETGASLVYIKKKNIISIILQAKKKGMNVNCTKESSDSLRTFRKIPFQLLQEFISISKKFSVEHGTEVHADIFYDIEQESFFMDVPEQIAQALFVEVTEPLEVTALKTIERKCVKVMEIHSV